MAYPYYGAQPYMGYTQPAPDQLAQLRMQQQYAPMQQPQQPQAPQQQAANPLIWVQGEAGAKAYMVAPGASVLLMDSERSSFYIKTADASGMPTMRIFDYTERGAQVAPAPAPTPEYVTRAEFDALRERIESLTKGATSDEKPAV